MNTLVQINRWLFLFAISGLFLYSCTKPPKLTYYKSKLSGVYVLRDQSLMDMEMEYKEISYIFTSEGDVETKMIPDSLCWEINYENEDSVMEDEGELVIRYKVVTILKTDSIKKLLRDNDNNIYFISGGIYAKIYTNFQNSYQIVHSIDGTYQDTIDFLQVNPIYAKRIAFQIVHNVLYPDINTEIMKIAQSKLSQSVEC